jgi:hypothetical protein
MAGVYGIFFDGENRACLGMRPQQVGRFSGGGKSLAANLFRSFGI